MPSPERVQAFIALVEQSRFVEAIEDFYTEDASMQENLQPPRKGRAVLVAHEKKVLASVKEARTLPGSQFFISGDHVVIRWVFEFVGLDGNLTRLDELAYQRWQGDRIAEERFYYDPGQLRPQTAQG